jgi:PAS domain S-box-containing protein
MSWVSVIWSVGVGTCLTLAFIQFVVWWKDRAACANLIFSVLAIAVATFAVLELALMRATTPEQLGTVVRWMHVPAWLMIASIVAFVRLYLKAGRQWLAWTVVGLRTVSLVLNFVFSPNINFREITTLQNVTFLGESVSVANGAANPWMLIAQSSLLLLVIFVTDATITVWRRGDRRKALMVGGSILLFVLMATVQAVGITWGIVSMPMTVSLFYQGLVIAMAYELSHHVFQATTLTRELQASEAGLRESEERFSIVADAAPVLIWMAGVDKLCTFFNKPWLDFTGRSLKQEMGNGWAEGVHPDDLQRCLKIYTEAFDARKAFVMQYRLRRNDGEYRWISDNGVPRYDAHKNFTGYIGSCIDVTELIIKDQALHDSKERIDLATKAAGLIVWSWDIARDEVWLSDKDRAIFGFSPSETLNAERIRSVVYAKDREFVSQLVEKSLATSEEIEAEYRIVLADGTVRWVTRRGRVECDRDGKPAWERGVLMDVTERKQAEEKFRLAVEASPSGIVLVDREGKIVLVNTQTEEMFGYSRAEMIGQPVEIIIPRRFRAIHPTHRESFLAMPKARAMGAGRELFARRKDGTEFPIEIGLNPIETAEGILVLAAVADITARKQAELEALKHREEMAQRNRVSLMGEMTASFAHELNQPLTAIANNASAARRFLERGNIDPALLQQLLHDMVADSQRAGEVIRGIRSLVRKEAGVRTLLDLNAVITDTVRLVSSDVLSRESVVTTELDPQLPQVSATLVQIQQVLLNLIINALDAMEGLPPAERRVVVSTRSDRGDVAEVSVRDFGTGLPKDQPDKVFDHFFSTKQKGMGMGLTIVRSIIEAHGGTIVAENAPDRGARMLVRLPAVRGQTQTTAAA